MAPLSFSLKFGKSKSNSLNLRFYQFSHNAILQMPSQHCCDGICKISLWFNHYNLRKSINIQDIPTWYILTFNGMLPRNVRLWNETPLVWDWASQICISETHADVYSDINGNLWTWTGNWLSSYFNQEENLWNCSQVLRTFQITKVFPVWNICDLHSIGTMWWIWVTQRSWWHIIKSSSGIISKHKMINISKKSKSKLCLWIP